MWLGSVFIPTAYFFLHPDHIRFVRCRGWPPCGSSGERSLHDCAASSAGALMSYLHDADAVSISPRRYISVLSLELDNLATQAQCAGAPSRGAKCASAVSRQR